MTARRVVLTSFFVDLLDVVLNLAVMLVTGSAVMAAELAQGASDLMASGFLLIGLKRPPRESYFWTLLSAIVMLLVASFLSFYFGLKRFLHPEEIHNLLVAYTALVIGASSNAYAFWLSARRLQGNDRNILKFFKKFSNSTLIMTKNTFVLDLMGMSSALLGLVALILYQVHGDLRFDGLGAMGIGVVLSLLSLRLILDIKDMTGKKVPAREM